MAKIRFSGSLRSCTKGSIMLALSWGWRYCRKVDDSQLCMIVYTCKDCEIKKHVYIIIRLLSICLFVLMLKILGRNTCVLKPAIYSNGKRHWGVIIIKKKKSIQPHKPVTSLDKCRVTFYWVTLYLL